MTPLLEARGLRVVLAGSQILRGADLVVPDGGVTVLLGRNGAGKTTALRALLGLVPRSGLVRFAGRDVSRISTHEIVRQGVGYVPEGRDVFTGLTVAENLRLAERTAHPRYERVYEIFSELRARTAQRAGTLSGGQQQMLAIARALLNPNRILLVDEPTKGLAPRLVTRVMEILAEVAADVTVLLVEQNLAAVKGVARHAIVLDQGATVYSGGFAEFAGDQELVRRHLGVALGASAS